MPASAGGGAALASSDWSSRRPSERAASATGGAAGARPRPLGRSGWLTTVVTATRPRSTSLRSTSAPKAEVPKNATSTSAGAEPQLAKRLSPVLILGPVEDEDTVEMVDLVLDHPRFEALGVELDLVALLIACGDADAQVPGHGYLQLAAEQRQAPLGPDLGLIRPLDQLGVDQDVGLILVAGAVDQDSTQDADLRRCQADA